MNDLDDPSWNPIPIDITRTIYCALIPQITNIMWCGIILSKCTNKSHSNDVSELISCCYGWMLPIEISNSLLLWQLHHLYLVCTFKLVEHIRWVNNIGIHYWWTYTTILASIEMDLLNKNTALQLWKYLDRPQYAIKELIVSSHGQKFLRTVIFINDTTASIGPEFYIL